MNFQRPLGVNQKTVLKILATRPWSTEDEWVWVSPSLTRNILDSLTKRGLVEVVDGVWRRV